jgi:WLM domain
MTLGLDHTKLVMTGRVLSDDSQKISELPGGHLAKIAVIGSRTLDAPSAPINAARIKDDFVTQPPPPPRPGNGKARYHIAGSSNVSYGFQSVETLRGLPNEDEARRILERLRDDPGVDAVMRKYNFSVGSLCELFPEGQVGVSEVCVMGLNQNKGQRILLRLRTDDLSGFRKFQSIKQVLFHELAHNVHSDHNSDFYVLMREIAKSADELDWTRSRARTLGGAAVYAGSGGISSAAHPDQSPNQVYRLGGDSTILTQLLPPQVLAGISAINRKSEEEQAIEDSCGSAPAGSDPWSHSEDSVSPPLENGNVESGICDTHGVAVESAADSPVMSAPAIESAIDAEIESLFSAEQIELRMLEIVDMAIANVYALEVIVPIERLMLLRTSLSQLVYVINEHQGILETLELVEKIITNARVRAR